MMFQQHGALGFKLFHGKSPGDKAFQGSRNSFLLAGCRRSPVSAGGFHGLVDVAGHPNENTSPALHDHLAARVGSPRRSRPRSVTHGPPPGPTHPVHTIPGAAKP